MVTNSNPQSTISRVLFYKRLVLVGRQGFVPFMRLICVIARQICVCRCWDVRVLVEVNFVKCSLLECSRMLAKTIETPFVLSRPPAVQFKRNNFILQVNMSQSQIPNTQKKIEDSENVLFYNLTKQFINTKVC